MTKTFSIQKREQLVDHHEKAMNTSLVMNIFLNSKNFDVIFDRCINKFMCKLLLWRMPVKGDMYEESVLWNEL